MTGSFTRTGGNELKYLEEVLNGQFSASTGYKMTKRLEESFAARFDSKYAIAFCNGTATLHACLEAAGVGIGDEVIVPPLTMSATTFAILHANAIPVFADVDMNTFNISPESVEKCVTPKTKAIITVALYGLSPDMDEIMRIAKAHDLVVIEDNAQCFLSTYKGRMAGTLGDMASYSFQASKHMTSGEGGMVITNNAYYAERVRKVSCLGYAGVSTNKGKISKSDIQSPEYMRHECMGWNYRMSELCGAVALAQLERLDLFVETRRATAALYEEAVGNTKWLRPQLRQDHNVNSYWTYALVLESGDWHAFRDKYVELGGDGVYAAWQLTYLEPMFTEMKLAGREKFLGGRTYGRGLCPNAEYLQPRMLQFKTNYTDMEKAKYKAEALHKTIEFFGR